MDAVEIDEGNIKIDVCVNENCGAIHLDLGELKEIVKDQTALSSAKNALLFVMNYPAAEQRGIFKSIERPKGRGIKPYCDLRKSNL